MVKISDSAYDFAISDQTQKIAFRHEFHQLLFNVVDLDMLNMLHWMHTMYLAWSIFTANVAIFNENGRALVTLCAIFFHLKLLRNVLAKAKGKMKLPFCGTKEDVSRQFCQTLEAERIFFLCHTGSNSIFSFRNSNSDVCH